MLFNTAGMAAIFNDSVFTDNVSINAFGGALAFWRPGSFDFNRCLFQGNTAYQYGGAISAISAAFISFTDCTFDSNTAGSNPLYYRGDHLMAYGGANVFYCGSNTFANPDLNFEHAVKYRGGAMELPCPSV